ncbi:hypothetical protein QBC38DRAFT_500012 [Podospora fimiseda]|uniref:Uncharacterized protein n=1 Tax=Podospora fimiseda TaxID=252190 RepID=A0AAN7GY62_9PEZI|nr:hypothetical protein QBC38DRAFT_500012 [Podospora fimiseda]
MLFFLLLFLPLLVSSRPQDLNKSPTNYATLYPSHCAESTSTIDTHSASGFFIGAHYTDYTNYVTRTWTTIYPSPEPTSFPTTVKLTHISSATNENWATLSNGRVEHNFVTMVVVSFEYEKELKSRPVGLEGGCRRLG